MCFAVADVERTLPIDEHTVRPRQRATARIRFRTVAAPSGAEHGVDDAAFQVDPPDGMIFRVRDVQTAMRARQPFRPGERRDASRPAVARISLLAGTGDVKNAIGLPIDAVDRVAFAQRKVEATFCVDGDGSWSVERGPAHRRAVRRRLAIAGTAVGVDHTGRQIDATDAMVADVSAKKLVRTWE